MIEKTQVASSSIPTTWSMELLCTWHQRILYDFRGVLATFLLSFALVQRADLVATGSISVIQLQPRQLSRRDDGVVHWI